MMRRLTAASCGALCVSVCIIFHSNPAVFWGDPLAYPTTVLLHVYFCVRILAMTLIKNVVLWTYTSYTSRRGSSSR